VSLEFVEGEPATRKLLQTAGVAFCDSVIIGGSEESRSGKVGLRVSLHGQSRFSYHWLHQKVLLWQCAFLKGEENGNQVYLSDGRMGGKMDTRRRQVAVMTTKSNWHLDGMFLTTKPHHRLLYLNWLTSKLPKFLQHHLGLEHPPHLTLGCLANNVAPKYSAAFSDHGIPTHYSQFYQVA